MKDISERIFQTLMLILMVIKIIYSSENQEILVSILLVGCIVIEEIKIQANRIIKLTNEIVRDYSF